MEVTEKKCKRCNETKPISEFPRQKQNKDGHHSWCRVCKATHAVQWKKDHPEWTRGYHDKALENNRKYKRANPEKIRKDARTYWDRVKRDPLHREKNRRYQAAYKQRTSERSRVRNQNAKLTVIAHYGGFCVCCGINDPVFLVLDHVNNDGGEHRKAQRKGGSFYKWIIATGWPSDLQVLCWNCNMGKHYNKGTCPHVEMRAALLAA